MPARNPALSAGPPSTTCWTKRRAASRARSARPAAGVALGRDADVGVADLPVAAQRCSRGAGRRSIETAKPTPLPDPGCRPDLRVDPCSTRPPASSSGTPELPLLIAASVCSAAGGQEGGERLDLALGRHTTPIEGTAPRQTAEPIAAEWARRPSRRRWSEAPSRRGVGPLGSTATSAADGATARPGDDRVDQGCLAEADEELAGLADRAARSVGGHVVHWWRSRLAEIHGSSPAPGARALAAGTGRRPAGSSRHRASRAGRSSAGRAPGSHRRPVFSTWCAGRQVVGARRRMLPASGCSRSRRASLARGHGAGPVRLIRAAPA